MILGSLRFAIWCKSSILTASSILIGLVPSNACGSAVLWPVLGPQEIGAELIEAWAADLAHYQVDLAPEDVDRLFDAGQSAGGGGVERRPPHEAEIGAEAERDQDVGATPHPAVKQQGQLVADRRLDRRQHVERARRLVELAPAMVRDEDAVAADIEGALRIGRAHDALDDERAREELPIGLQVAPGLRVERPNRRGEFVNFLGVRARRRVGLPVAEHRRAAAALQVFDDP